MHSWRSSSLHSARWFKVRNGRNDIAELVNNVSRQPDSLRALPDLCCCCLCCPRRIQPCEDSSGHIILIKPACSREALTSVVDVYIDERSSAPSTLSLIQNWIASTDSEPSPRHWQGFAVLLKPPVALRHCSTGLQKEKPETMFLLARPMAVSPNRPSSAMTHTNQSFLGPPQLKPRLRRPVPLRPGLLRPGPLRPGLLGPGQLLLISVSFSSSSPSSSFFVLLHLLFVLLRFFLFFVPNPLRRPKP